MTHEWQSERAARLQDVALVLASRGLAYVLREQLASVVWAQWWRAVAIARLRRG
jgi:hypothetical protein